MDETCSVKPVETVGYCGVIADLAGDLLGRPGHAVPLK
jgi:hypothetical protein